MHLPTTLPMLLILLWIYLGGVNLTDKKYDWEWPITLGRALADWANRNDPRVRNPDRGEGK